MRQKYAKIYLEIWKISGVDSNVENIYGCQMKIIKDIINITDMHIHRCTCV